MKTEKHTMTYGKHTIHFEVERKEVKNINLNVRPDMRILVSANKEVPIDVICAFVQSKAAWIIKNIAYFKDVQPEYMTKKLYLSGESFKYLGKQYRLKVQQTNQHESVKYYRGYIYLLVKDKHDDDKKEKLVRDWYRLKAKEKFEESLDRMYPMVEKLGVARPKIHIRTMKARWGSSSSDKQSILLNRELIKAPKLCIDYVVLHELIHGIYRNHDADFYTFLTMRMPDWKQRKVILDEDVVREL